MRATSTNTLLNIVIIAILWGWGLSQMSVLPQQMPIHFDMNGQPNRYAGKSVVISFMPILCLSLVALVWCMGKCTRHGWGERNAPQVAKYELAVTCFLMFMHILFIMEARYPQEGILTKNFAPALCLLMIVLGNYLGKLERNRLVGIRVPWTLRSEANWRKTHRFSGKLLVAGGIVALVISLAGAPMAIPIAILISLFLVSILYSYHYYVNHEKDAAADAPR